MGVTHPNRDPNTPLGGIDRPGRREVTRAGLARPRPAPHRRAIRAPLSRHRIRRAGEPRARGSTIAPSHPARPREAARQAGLAARAAQHLVPAHQRHLAERLARGRPGRRDPLPARHPLAARRAELLAEAGRRVTFGVLTGPQVVDRLAHQVAGSQRGAEKAAQACQRRLRRVGDVVEAVGVGLDAEQVLRVAEVLAQLVRDLLDLEELGEGLLVRLRRELRAARRVDELRVRVELQALVLDDRVHPRLRRPHGPVVGHGRPCGAFEESERPRPREAAVRANPQFAAELTLTLADGRRIAVAFFARGGGNRPAVIATAARAIYDAFVDTPHAATSADGQAARAH